MHACLSGHYLYLFCLKMTMRWYTQKNQFSEDLGILQQTSSSVKAGGGGGSFSLQWYSPPNILWKAQIPHAEPCQPHGLSHTSSACLGKLRPNSSFVLGKWLPVRKASLLKFSSPKGLPTQNFYHLHPSIQHHLLAIPIPQKTPNPSTRQVSWVPSCTRSQGLLEKREKLVN